jgi:glycosyl transferase family 25
MKVYVLGLKEAFRGTDLVTYLRDLGFEPETVFGVDARSFTSEEFLSLYSNWRSIRIMNRELTPMEVACAIGHRNIYEKFAQTNEEWAMILEEDGVPTENFTLDKVSLKFLNEPVVINLQGASRILKQYDEFPHLIYGVNNLSENEIALNVYSVIGNVQGAFAYLMNRQAALIAIDSYKTIDSVADWPYAWRNKVTFALTDQAQFGVNLEGSVIAEGRSKKLAKVESQLKVKRFFLFPNRLRTLIGLFGLPSALRFFQRLGFLQDYQERFLFPFLIRRFRNLRRQS